jgi:hypothetical protein
MLVVLLNFLIALISEKYQFTMGKVRYKIKKSFANFNTEYFAFMRTYFTLQDFEAIILSRELARDFEIS